MKIKAQSPLLTAIFVMLIAVAPYAAAQTAPNDNLEIFRAELATYLVNLQEVAQLLSENSTASLAFSRDPGKAAASISASRDQLPQVTYIQLEAVKRALDLYPDWKNHPDTLKSLLRPEVLKQMRAGAVSSYSKGSRRKEGVPDDCALAAASAVTLTDVFIAANVATAASAATQAAGFVVLGVTNPLYFGFVAAWFIVEEVRQGLEYSHNVAQECQDNTFQADTTSRLTSIEGKVDLLNGKADYIIKISDEIEAREVEESIDWCRPLASIILEGSKGGRLEQVRDIVQVLINSATLVGPPAFPASATATATTHFNLGLSFLIPPAPAVAITGGNPKAAFQYFCKAYAALVKTP